MGVVEGKWKKNLILKAWERCRLSLGSAVTGNKRSSLKAASKSLSENDYEKGQIAPYGCFSVYVGPLRQRFVVKTDCANHQLFKLLLEEAEMEYGFQSDGPIWLPCNVDLFYRVLAEMEMDAEDDSILSSTRRTRSFTKAKGYSFFVLRIPARLFRHMNNGGHSAYRVMDSKMLKMNQFQ